MYLLDTPVLFELRKARSGGADPRVAAWAGDVPREQLFVSALALAEIEALAARAPRGEQAGAVRRWIDDQLVPAFGNHVLPVDTAVARRRGQVGLASDRRALVAATALEHGLTLVTFDAAAYRGVRLKLFDPRRYDPDAAVDDWRAAAARSGPLWFRNLFLRS
ncbi:PIN domain-containing protein [Sphingomonas azotifigens]|uniref:PIN domain-containing protein n=1 Tax=Sphingomonas azotifigens TaxID=330920 RepID=UPI000A04BC8A|nr:PIN domain-containing protein [Sphingomonas azotifigens]